VVGIDIVELDRRTLVATGDIVAAVTPGDLDRLTPCAGWTLRDLLAHMIAQHHGFAAAASGEPTEPADWRPRPVGDDPAGEYNDSAAQVTAAFGAPGVLERLFWLPEVRTSEPFPAATAIGFHFIDYVTHGWDVARSIGVPARFDDDLVAAVLPLVERVPDTPKFRGPDKAFMPGIAVPPDAPPLDRVVAMLGRDPGWKG
jgi:uncharacterized protein (TIGR03086 family)